MLACCCDTGLPSAAAALAWAGSARTTEALACTWASPTTRRSRATAAAMAATRTQLPTSPLRMLPSLGKDADRCGKGGSKRMGLALAAAVNGNGTQVCEV